MTGPEGSVSLRPLLHGPGQEGRSVPGLGQTLGGEQGEGSSPPSTTLPPAGPPAGQSPPPRQVEGSPPPGSSSPKEADVGTPPDSLPRPPPGSPWVLSPLWTRSLQGLTGPRSSSQADDHGLSDLGRCSAWGQPETAARGHASGATRAVKGTEPLRCPPSAAVVSTERGQAQSARQGERPERR